MAITTEQIHATADQLASEGIKPTQTAVRERLGGGSFTTIVEALKTWRQEQHTTAQLAEVVLPNDLDILALPSKPGKRLIVESSALHSGNRS